MIEILLYYLKKVKQAREILEIYYSNARWPIKGDKKDNYRRVKFIAI